MHLQQLCDCVKDRRSGRENEPFTGIPQLLNVLFTSVALSSGVVAARS